MPGPRGILAVLPGGHKMLGARARTVVKRARRSFSLSPRHFDVRVAQEQLKNVTFSAAVATACRASQFAAQSVPVVFFTR